MKNLLILWCLIMFCFQISLMAGHTSKHSEWRNGILILTYNGETQMFPGWNQEANDFYQNGPKSRQPSSETGHNTALINAVNELRRENRAQQKTINDHSVAITEMVRLMEMQSNEFTKLRTVAFTRTWTDDAGNSIAGTFITYDLGSLKIRKLSDQKEYTIPASRLSPASKEMALALDRLKLASMK